MIGERNQRHRSARFARLIKSDNYTAAVQVAASRCAAART
jgi:cobalamin-dependent methionine synthase I